MSVALEVVFAANIAQDGVDGRILELDHLAALLAIEVFVLGIAVVVLVKHARPQLEPAVLNVRQSYVFAEQQGLATRLNTFLGGNPNSQQALYVAAQKRIQAAAQRGPLLADAQQNKYSESELLERLRAERGV